MFLLLLPYYRQQQQQLLLYKRQWFPGILIQIQENGMLRTGMRRPRNPDIIYQSKVLPIIKVIQRAIERPPKTLGDGDDGDTSSLLGGSTVDGISVGLYVEGIWDGNSDGADVVGIVQSTMRSGHEDAGPIKGFKYKHEHSSIEPSLVGTVTRSPDRAQTKKSSSSSPEGEKTQ
jgi:hypothetical protein